MTISGKSIDYATFEELCQRLALNWREIAELDFQVAAQTIDKNPKSPELSSAKQDLLPLYPSGSVPLGSPFYLERAPIEEQVNQEIRKPGALIRIKAPRQLMSMVGGLDKSQQSSHLHFIDKPSPL